MRQTKVHGNPATLVGEEIKVGQIFPNFKAADKDLNDFELSSTNGVRVLLAVPSVDTPVCDGELKKMAKEIANIEGINLLAISMDLPFAQTRWCVDAENEDDIQIVSDFKYHEFADKAGALIKEMGLLTRCSFVLDKEGKVLFVEYMDEIGFEPNYEEILKVAKAAL